MELDKHAKDMDTSNHANKIAVAYFEFINIFYDFSCTPETYGTRSQKCRPRLGWSIHLPGYIELFILKIQKLYV
jgi:hypothetical protein